MKAIDVRKKSPQELQKLLDGLQADLREFRFGMSGGRTKNVKKARAIPADIARVPTVLSAKPR